MQIGATLLVFPSPLLPFSPLLSFPLHLLVTSVSKPLPGNTHAIQILVDLGFRRDHAHLALRACGGEGGEQLIPDAIDWLCLNLENADIPADFTAKQAFQVETWCATSLSLLGW